MVADVDPEVRGSVRRLLAWFLTHDLAQNAYVHFDSEYGQFCFHAFLKSLDSYHNPNLEIGSGSHTRPCARRLAKDSESDRSEILVKSFLTSIW